MEKPPARLHPRYPNPWTNPFMLTEDMLPSILLAVVVEALLYGMHVILFCICVRVLCGRKRWMQIAMLVAVVVMFLLSTADIGVTWNLLLRHTKRLYQSDSIQFYMAIYPKFVIFLVNNFIADVLLIARCYVVWGNRKSILFTCLASLLVGTAFGIISEGTTTPSLKKFIAVFILVVLVLNVGVTLLTAGRIFWIAREVRSIMGPKMVSHYHFAICILIESGVVYSASTILILCLSPTKFVLMAGIISIRMVCIMPTLLIVQIALGQSTKDVSSTVSKMQMASTQPVILDTVISNSGSGWDSRTRHQRSTVIDVEGPRQTGSAIDTVRRENS